MVGEKDPDLSIKASKNKRGANAKSGAYDRRRVEPVFNRT